MNYQVDQSGKIEDTSKNTILCLANGYWYAVIIKARVKRQIQEVFRRNGQNRNFVIFTLCAGLSLLLKENPKVKRVFVDREYYGKEAVIGNVVLEMWEGSSRLPEIHFAFIGKSAKAHDYAAKVAHKKAKFSKALKLKEVVAEIKKTEVGKRLKDA